MSLLGKLRGMKILIINDNEDVRHSLSLFFGNEGCHISALKTAERALEEVKKEVYDIIIANYRLPGIDGMKFFRQIQEINPYALKILTTKYVSEEIVPEAIKIGIHALIEKPLTAKTIEQALSSFIEECEQILSNPLNTKKEFET